MNMKKQLLIACFLIGSLFGGKFALNGQTYKYVLPSGTYTLSYIYEGEGVTITASEFSPGFSGALEIPESLDGKPVLKIGFQAFYQKADLKSVTFPSSLKVIDQQAFKLSGLNTALEFPNGLESIGSSAFSDTKISGTINFPLSLKTLGSLCFANTTNLEYVYFPEGSPVKMIPDEAFVASGIKNISFPQGLTSIGSKAYSQCKRVQDKVITLPSSLTSIGAAAFAFWRRDSGSLLIPEHNDLVQLVIPDDSQLTTIGKNAFRNGRWVGDFTLPSKVTRIEDGVFLRNEQWDGHITLHENLTYIGANAFELMGSTQDLVIPSKVITIGNSAFYGSPFSSILFAPNSELTTLGTSAFRSCFNLSALDLRSITKLHSENASREASPTNPSQYAYMPPYTMVYLPPNSTVKEGEVNFVKDDGVCDNFVVYDNSTTYFPPENRIFDNDRNWLGQNKRIIEGHPTPENFGAFRGCDYKILDTFTAKKATYKNRTFAKEVNKTYTITLPYSATVPAGMDAYELKEKHGKEYYFVKVESRTMTAYRPYLLRVMDISKSLVFGEDTEVVVAKTEDATLEQTAGDNMIFRGTTTNIMNAEARNKKYYTLNGGIWYGIFTKEGATWAPQTFAEAEAMKTQAKSNGFQGYIHSMRAYIEDPVGTMSTKFFMIFDNYADAGATNIEEIENQVKSGNAPIYNVEGHYLGTNLDELPSGNIYIVNGKKIYKY